MKKIVSLFVLFFISSFIFAQKIIYDAHATVRNVKGYTAIKVSGGIDLYLSYGEEAVAVSAKNAEVANHIKTEVTEGVLKIWYEWKDGGNLIFTNHKQLKAYVSYKTLQALYASGGSDILVDGTINSAALSLDISGGSDFKGKVQVQKLSVDASGGSDVDMEGSAATADMHISGGSDFGGYGLIAESATIHASGGCDIEITVNGLLSASASGASHIRYKGTGNSNNSKSSGASSIKKVSR